jgi:transcriptional regulator with XRE-family HTH domain
MSQIKSRKKFSPRAIKSNCKAEFMNYTLRNARIRAGLRQSDLAQATGLSRASIESYEVCRRNPTPEGARQIALILNREVSHLFPESLYLEVEGTPIPEGRKALRINHCLFPKEENPFDSAVKSELSEIISEFLSVLTPKQRRVLEQSFGLNGETESSDLEIVAREGYANRQTVESLRKAAFGRLYHKIKHLALEHLGYLGFHTKVSHLNNFRLKYKRKLEPL